MLLTGTHLRKRASRRARLAEVVPSPAGHRTVSLDTARMLEPTGTHLRKRPGWRARLTIIIRSPTNNGTVALHQTGVIRAGADLREGAARDHLVAGTSPTGHGAVGARERK